MAWDRDEPENTTKIRNGPGLIRDNFQAIDSDDSSFKLLGARFDNRNTSAFIPAPNADPTAIASVYQLYAKNDVTGNTALYGRDPASVITQFTDSRRTLAQNGAAVIPPGILVNWGRATIPNGTQTVSVVFTTNFSGDPWVIHVTPYENPTPAGGSNSREIGADNFAPGGFDARCFNGKVLQDTLVGWIAIGIPS